VRVGIVGFGKLARDYYVPALRRIPSVRVSAVADPLATSLESARRCFPEASLFLTSEDLIGQCHLDAVLVASPPSTHWTVWKQATQGGLPVFMEKPFPMRADLHAAETCADTGKTVMVNFNRRFWPPYRQMASLARDGAIGRLMRLELLLHVDVQGWCGVTSHRMSRAEGGALEDLGSHVVDLVFLLSGEQTVKARGTADLNRARLQMETEHGIVAACDLAYGKANREQIVIYGDRGRLVLRNPNCSVHREPARFAGRLEGLIRDALVFGNRAFVRDKSMLRHTIRLALEAFFEAARSGTLFQPGMKDGIRVARVLEKAMQGAAS
jgi:predicted dehydrogenase